MQIYLFIIDGKPEHRLSLAEAQAVLEDRMLQHRDVTDVWWDDEDPYWARKYLYGSSHSDYVADEDAEVDFETTDQIIWPVSLDGEHKQESHRSVRFAEAELSMTVRTSNSKDQILRVVPEMDWMDEKLRAHIVLNFAVNAGQALADHLTSKERT